MTTEDPRFAPPPERTNCLGCKHGDLSSKQVVCCHPGREAPTPVVRWYGLNCRQYETPTTETRA